MTPVQLCRAPMLTDRDAALCTTRMSDPDSLFLSTVSLIAEEFSDDLADIDSGPALTLRPHLNHHYRKILRPFRAPAAATSGCDARAAAGRNAAEYLHVPRAGDPRASW